MRNARRIHQRTIDLLDEIAQYRLAMIEQFRRRYFARVHEAGVASWFQRRIENEQVMARRLYGNRRYYCLTEKAVRILRAVGRHVSRWVTRPLGPDAKRTHFAFVYYCNPEGGPLRNVLRPAFDAERFPHLTAQQVATHRDPFRRKLFYREGETVGYFVVDRGQPRFIADKVRPKLFDLLTPAKYPEMRALVEAEQFRLTVATATNERAEELEFEFLDPEPPFPVEVVVIPELVHLMPKAKKSTRPRLF